MEIFNIPEKWKFIQIGNKEEFLPDYKILKITINNFLILLFFKKNTEDAYFYGGSNINKMLFPKPLNKQIYDPQNNLIINQYLGKSHNMLAISNNCFELVNYLNGYKINIFQLDECVSKSEDCKGLDLIFNTIFKLLTILDFKQSLYIEDDAGFSTYCKYGFKWTSDSLKILEINKDYLDKKDIPEHLQNLLMINNNFAERKDMTKCLYTDNCNFPFTEPKILTLENSLPEEVIIEGNKKEEDFSLPMSLDDLSDMITQKEEIDAFKIWVNDLDIYLKSGKILNEAIAETILPLDLDFHKINLEIRIKLIKLLDKILKNYGLELKSNPVRIDDLGEIKKWIKKDSEDYLLIARILGFYILSGMRKLSYKFLVRLLDLYKMSQGEISYEDFRKWNKLLSIY